MKINNRIIVGALVLVVFAGAYFVFTDGQKDTDGKTDNSTATQMKDQPLSEVQKPENSGTVNNAQNDQSPETIEKEQATAQEDAPDLTEEEIYKNPFVTHIRVALNGYLDGSNTGVEDSSVINGIENSGLDCGLSKYDKSYFKSKFIVWSSETNKYGGRSTYIIFTDKPDTIFWAWVYKIDTDEYILRSFCASGPKEEDKAKFPEMIKAMLKDGKFPYSL